MQNSFSELFILIEELFDIVNECPLVLKGFLHGTSS